VTVYEAIKRATLRVLRVPPEPEDPFGRTGSLRVFRAAPSYWKYRLLGWWLGQAFVFIGGILAFAALHGGAHVARTGVTVHALLVAFEILGLVFGVCQAFVSYAALRLDFEMRWYKVTDRSLRIREGVFIVREQTMTFANVQNVSILQGPLERWFGFANLEVRSAGGGGRAQGGDERQAGWLDMHRAVFRGLENATEIRDLVMDRLRRAKDGGLGDPDDVGREDAPPSPPAAGSGAVPGGRAALLASLRDEAAALRRAAEACRG
jgi:membrane protein YdbS with pleckstrin-like domain